MQINVNGQSYQRWEDVPADIRATLQAKLPDADGNGVPDFLEGGALPTTEGSTVTSTSFAVDGQAYTTAADLPPAVRQALQQAGLGSFLDAASTNAAAPAPTPPAPPRQTLLNGEPVESTTILGTEPKRWWQFWK